MDSGKTSPFKYSDYVCNTLNDDQLSDELKAQFAFYAAIADEDDATAVIRGMSYVESLVMAVIRNNLEHPRLIKEGDLSLSDRLMWAQAMGEITKEIVEPITAASVIRNRFAHRGRVVNIDNLDQQLVKNLVERARKLFTGHILDSERAPGFSEAKWHIRMAIQFLVNVLITIWWNPPHRERSRRVQPTGVIRAGEGGPEIGW